MQKNIGHLDAIIRISVGAAGLAWSTSRMVLRPHHFAPLLLALLSGMKIAEGIVRVCPMLSMMGKSTLGSEHEGQSQSECKPKDIPLP
ncbi:DUF2892 domain-containing protein [Mechercharimyces sp. CAU 1602]|uniref:YgaP family membrane protein n=1 Tax=Mechercharimyces sp. CAU 1602 TaxID=2973933 RepID=UPI00216156CF|nr:DUF2892 domain-containing protein [Mechercharimyces sp. CAU 1602]MCS1352002.1 DUF2892 domain-containing protein [Mechercharimyces sp. CAU 1602]